MKHGLHPVVAGIAIGAAFSLGGLITWYISGRGPGGRAVADTSERRPVIGAQFEGPADTGPPQGPTDSLRADGSVPHQLIGDAAANTSQGQTKSVAAESKTAQERIDATFSLLAAREARSRRPNKLPGAADNDPLAASAWHQQLLDEPRDAQWSPGAESALQDNLPDVIPSGVEVSDVQCSGSRCEIRAIVTAPSSSEDLDRIANSFDSTIVDLAKQSWWKTEGFESPNSIDIRTPDNGQIFVVHIARTTQPPLP